MSQASNPQSSREGMAKREIGHTEITRGMCLALTASFLLVIAGVPVAQQTREWLTNRAKGVSGWPQAFEIFGAIPEAHRAWIQEGQAGGKARIFRANGVLLRAIASYEKRLEDRSFLSEYFIPRMQGVTARWVGLGNEQVYLGRDGWLFYRPDIDYLTGPGFLNPAFQKRRALGGDASVGSAEQPDPVAAIVHLKTQLGAKDIHLILMPVPVKGVIEPEHFSGRYSSGTVAPVQNPSYADFLHRMEEAGVDVLDVSGALIQQKATTGRPQYLKTDTHWTPEAMELAASLLAGKIRALPGISPTPAAELLRGEETIAGVGDTATMLKLPNESSLFPPETARIFPVQRTDGTAWLSDPEAEILVLGDSFANIYSLAEMGWGASSGFVEQLSFQLQKPVDSILRNDAGAYATRELLSKKPSQGRDRLAGKKVVVWEFAMRELASGDWKILPLSEAPRNGVKTTEAAASFFVPEAGRTLTAEGTLLSRSDVPRPGTVPYKDQVFAVHLSQLQGENIPDGSQAVVYLFGMTNNEPTPASAWKVGERVRLNLQSWEDVAAKYERFNRSELDDPDLQLETPSWGEPLP